MTSSVGKFLRLGVDLKTQGCDSDHHKESITLWGVMWRLYGVFGGRSFHDMLVICVHPSIDLWAQRPLVSNAYSLPQSSLGEFLGNWAGSGILGYWPCWYSSPFPSPSIFRCFPFPLLHQPLDFIHVSSLRPMYLHPIGRPFTYSLFRWVSRLWTGSGTRCCGPRGGTGVCIEHKSQSKFLPGRGSTSDLGIQWPRTLPLDYHASLLL